MVALLKKLCLTVAVFLPAFSSAGTVFEPSLRLLVEERFDDDVRTTLPGEAGQLMSKLTPQLGLAVRERTLTVDSWYAMDFLYRHGSGNTTLDHRGQLSLDKRFTDRLSLDADLRVWRVTDPTSLPRPDMVRTLSPVLYGRAEAAGRFRATRRFTLRPGYRFEGARLEEAGNAAGFSHQPYLEGWYRLNGRMEIGADYRAQFFLFEDQSSQSHGMAAALRYRLFRRVGLTVRAGPTAFLSGEGGYQLAPRLLMDLYRDGEYFDLTLSAGHDLAGASGIRPAVWSDYASVTGEWRFWRPVRIYAHGSFNRNGPAPAEGWADLNGASWMGYALAAGVEWEALRQLSLIFSVTRQAQLGEVDRSDADAVRPYELNIVSLKLNFRAF